MYVASGVLDRCFCVVLCVYPVYGPFCHGALKPGMSTLFTTFLNSFPIYCNVNSYMTKPVPLNGFFSVHTYPDRINIKVHWINKSIYQYLKYIVGAYSYNVFRFNIKIFYVIYIVKMN